MISNILIVSRTRMREKRVCVGGIDLTSNQSVRLLDPNGYHEHEDECPYEIGDIWTCNYVHNSRRPAPHLEDSNVKVRLLLEKHACKNAEEFKKIFSFHGIRIFEGNIDNCFDGCLINDGRRYYIDSTKVPQYSTCFWINDYLLKNNDYQKPDGGIKKQLSYMNGTSPYGRNITYVGIENMPISVPVGSLIRLSLANWWSRDENTTQRCYLQVSGIY